MDITMINCDINQILQRTVEHLVSSVDEARSYLETVRSLLSHGADVNVQDRRGETPLHDACAIGSHPATARLLLEHGSEVNTRGEDGNTPPGTRRWIVISTTPPTKRYSTCSESTCVWLATRRLVVGTS